jgi:glucose/mannose-6-phosphate isomerase
VSASGENRLDTLGIFDAAASLPEQMETAIEAAKSVHGLPSGGEIDNVLVLGMGGSGVTGELLQVIAGPFMPVPVVVVKGYTPPSYTNERTLVFAMSFSGETEETLEAVETVGASGARIVAVTRGGRLKEATEGWGGQVVPIADGIPQPRTGLGALAVPPLIVLERMGLFPGAEQWVTHAIAQLKTRRDELVKDDNCAELLARRIGRTLPIIYGGGGLGAVAATRWKTEINENARVAAFWNTSPELCHNEIAGWGQHGDMTRQVFTLVKLRHDFEHPQVMRRFDLIDEVAEEVLGGVESVEAAGEGNLAQLFDLSMIGTFTSLHMAAQEGIDPGPVPVLDWMKQQLRA